MFGNFLPSPLLNPSKTLVNIGVWLIKQGKSDVHEESIRGSQRGSLAGVLPNNFVAWCNAGGTALAQLGARSLGGRVPCARRIFRIAIAASFCLAGSASATTPSPNTLTCSWESIGAKYNGLNPYLLYAIAKQESSLNPKVVSKPNQNGTVDIGLMQINSAWLPTLASRFGITRSDLFKPCVNLDVGAWVLYENFKTFGYSWRAIGAYNAKSEDKRLAYVRKVYRHVPPHLKHQH